MIETEKNGYLTNSYAEIEASVFGGRCYAGRPNEPAPRGEISRSRHTAWFRLDQAESYQGTER